MTIGDWNFLAGRLNGEGGIDIVETELPIEVSSISRTLSTPSSMSGTITNAVKRLKADGRPIFDPWNTVIIAEAAGLIRGMSVYQEPTFNGNKWDLDLVGLSAYPINMPYDGARSFIDADPLDLFRHIWQHLQGFPGGDLGITIADTTSPVRVGTPAKEGDNESGPRNLNWWETTNLGAVIDDLAKEAPFDWLETYRWEGEQPRCHLALGHPIIGGRKDTTLVLGENLAAVPSITELGSWNQAWTLGAGEGRDRVRGYAGVNDGRLRRIKVVDDKGVPDKTRADSRARDELNGARGQLVVETVEVFDHPNAPLEGIELGDEMILAADTEHVDFFDWVRVVGKDESPQRDDVATLTLVRTIAA